jgi:hypothetical protein
MIRLRSFITAEDSRACASRLLRIPAAYIAPKRFHQTDGLVADVDPALGGSSTLSRDTGHRSDITVIRRMPSGEPVKYRATLRETSSRQSAAIPPRPRKQATR